tara:strand:+ start:123 stop:263 length:141 start_codon:yes stop_codon:yes gene_type:complete
MTMGTGADLLIGAPCPVRIGQLNAFGAEIPYNLGRIFNLDQCKDAK